MLLNISQLLYLSIVKYLGKEVFYYMKTEKRIITEC